MSKTNGAKFFRKFLENKVFWLLAKNYIDLSFLPENGA